MPQIATVIHTKSYSEASAPRLAPPTMVRWSTDTVHNTGSPRRSWHLVPLILLVGFGEHCITHALMPTEPALHQIGLSPFLYGVISVLPKLGSIFTPALWGHFFSLRPRIALGLAPSLLVFAQLLLVFGLISVQSGYPWVAASTLALGFILSALSKAGVSVLQHACLALVLPGSATHFSSTHKNDAFNHDEECGPGSSFSIEYPQTPDTPGPIPREGSWLWARRDSSSGHMVAGLCLNVGCTHLIGAAVVYAVPRLLNAYGLVGLQFALTIPTLIGAFGGLALACVLPNLPLPEHPPSPKPLRRGHAEPFVVACSSCGELIRGVKPYSGITCDKCLERQVVQAAQREAICALGLWRATLIGTLHALATLSVPLLVSHQYQLQSAGSLVALSGAGALIALPLLAAAARSYRTLQMLLLAISLAVIATAAAFTLADALGGDGGSWTCPAETEGSLPGMMMPYDYDDEIEQEKGGHDFSPRALQLSTHGGFVSARGAAGTTGGFSSPRSARSSAARSLAAGSSAVSDMRWDNQGMLT